MQISQRGLDLIVEFEGCILQSYDDYNDRIINQGDTVRGTLTIGIGHIEGVYKGQTITKEEAYQLLRDDMNNKYCPYVNQAIADGTISFPVNQNMFDSLSSFCYNCGNGSLRTLCRNRDKQTVADMMLEYRNKGSVWEQGLLRRRRAERELFLSTDNSAPIQSQPIQPQINQKVVELQKICGISADGIWGNQTDNAVRNLPLAGLPYRTPQLTTWVQLRLGCIPDGIFGQATYNAVVAYQASHGLVPDGIVGYNTIRSLALC